MGERQDATYPAKVGPPDKPSANNRQVAGNHYREIAEKAGVPQHWDMMWRLYGEAWFVGCVTKYVLRYRKKNGVEDLKKGLHYLEKLIELEQAKLDAEDQPLTPSPTSTVEVISYDAGNGERKQIEFGRNLLCNCDCGTMCPLGKRTGMEERCTMHEVRNHLRTKE